MVSAGLLHQYNEKQAEQWLQKVTASCSSKTQNIHVTSLGVNQKRNSTNCHSGQGAMSTCTANSGQGSALWANPYSKSSTFVVPGAEDHAPRIDGWHHLVSFPGEPAPLTNLLPSLCWSGCHSKWPS